MIALKDCEQKTQTQGDRFVPKQEVTRGVRIKTCPQALTKLCKREFMIALRGPGNLGKCIRNK